MAGRKQSTQKRPAAASGVESAPEHWLRTIRMSGFTITMLVIIIGGVVVVAPSLRLLVEQRQQIDQLQHAVDQQKGDVTKLQGEVDRWSDPAYIESEARNRLLYVYPGEYSYLVVGGATGKDTEDRVPISASIQSTHVDWARSLLSSLLTAGLSTAVPGELVSPALGSTP